MKTLAALTAGYFLPSVINSITTHPDMASMFVGVFVGILAGLLVALVMATPAGRQPVAIAQPVRRQPRRTVRASKPAQAYTFQPTNYEWGMA